MHGSTHEDEERANKQSFESTCSRFGCDAQSELETQDGAVIERCEDGHVETTVVNKTSTSTDAQAETDVPEDDEHPDGVSKGAIDGTLDRSERESKRPDEDEVGSSPDRSQPEVVDPSDYL